MIPFSFASGVLIKTASFASGTMRFSSQRLFSRFIKFASFHNLFAYRAFFQNRESSTPRDMPTSQKLSFFHFISSFVTTFFAIHIMIISVLSIFRKIIFIELASWKNIAAHAALFVRIRRKVFSMYFHMLCQGTYLQILNSIIRFIHIFVMRNLCLFQLSTKVLLQNIAMFKNLLFAKAKHYITAQCLVTVRGISLHMANFSTPLSTLQS